MRPAVFLVFLAISTAFGVSPAATADYAPVKALRTAPGAPASSGPVLPFPRGERAARVWDSRACWSACQTVCTADAAACLRAGVTSQADCATWTDACDRACQRDCRSGAGPLLPLD